MKSFALKPEYRKLLDIYPHLESGINYNFSRIADSFTSDSVLTINELTGCNDSIWITRDMLILTEKFELDEEFGIEIKDPELKEAFQQACYEQLGDGFTFITVYTKHGSITINKNMIK